MKHGRDIVKMLFSTLLLPLLALQASPAASQPDPARLPPKTETMIALAVAEARCTGRHQQMVARYRPDVAQRLAAPLRQAGQVMAARYQAVHGADWQAALAADLVAARTRFEQQARQPEFCKAQAMIARTLSRSHDDQPNGLRGTNAEMDLYRLAAR
ncbi:hypothetical protein CHU93_15015 [Sandarakinorhabdus cyanobacteriorum]|uniref:Lysozyme inhibitor LprI N-terminal domain-containing protein n=2 Tax=Sandarakinorhabdus cyanobacteriorum TaxID=1981098 RepID=A0A255Y681_9SPHN|nr:hypothetical protein CHU93_15015 [Sandarakinorhabdus cyanobacteriorum]